MGKNEVIVSINFILLLKKYIFLGCSLVVLTTSGGSYTSHCLLLYCSQAKNICFFIFKWLKKNIFWHMKITSNSNFNFCIKLYCNRATLIHVHMVCGCFCAVSSELSSFDQDHMQSLKFIWFGPLEENFVNPCSRESDSEVLKKEQSLIWFQHVFRWLWYWGLMTLWKVI